MVDYMMDLLLEKRKEIQSLKEELNALKDVVKFYEEEWAEYTKEKAERKKGRVVCDCGNNHSKGKDIVDEVTMDMD